MKRLHPAWVGARFSIRGFWVAVFFPHYYQQRASVHISGRLWQNLSLCLLCYYEKNHGKHTETKQTFPPDLTDLVLFLPK